MLNFHIHLVKNGLSPVFYFALVLSLREAVLKAYDSIEYVFVLSILDKVSGSYKLESIGGLSINERGLNLTIIKPY